MSGNNKPDYSLALAIVAVVFVALVLLVLVVRA